MPFTHANISKQRAREVMLVVSIILLSATVYIAFSSEDLILRYGLLFVSGILAMGIWYRVGKLLSENHDTCSFDQNSIEWCHDGVVERIEWKDVVRCMVITIKGVTIRIKTNDTITHHISADCLPDETGELLAILKDEVMPKCGWVCFSLDNEILQNRQAD